MRAPLPLAPLDDAQRLACLRLALSENVGPVAFRELINLFGGAAPALEALPRLAGRGGKRSVRVCPRDRAEAQLQAARRVGAEIVFTIEPGYPMALASLEVPPPMLYLKGRKELLSRPAIAIVGSRNCSAAGHSLARQWSEALGRAGLIVVSGLARGIDAAAHAAALSTGTVAVLAGGVDVAYPPENADLQARIAEEGCLIAELPPGYAPRGQDFPRRNRIISGVARAVVIVEAARRSGSLITARLANEQGRQVYAAPGHPLDPRAEGTNQLIKSGATLVTSAHDILSDLRPSIGLSDEPDGHEVPSGRRHMADRAPSPEPFPDDDAREKVVAALGPAPVGIDELARATGLAARDLQIVLLELSLAGRIDRQGGGLVSLRAA